MKDLFNRFKNKVSLWEIALIVVAVTMPFPIMLNSIAICILVGASIFVGRWRERWMLFKINPYSVLLAGLFGFHLIGILYTENVNQGWFEVEKKISLLVFPLFITSSGLIKGRVIRNVLYSFTIACFIASLICLGNGIYKYFHGDISYMFYHNLSYTIGIHAIYFSLYIGVCIFFIFFELKENYKRWSNKTQVVLMLLLIYFLLFLLLLSSKMLTVVIFLSFILQLAIFIFHSNGLRTSLVSLMLVSGFVFTIIFSVSSLRERFTDILSDKYDQENPLYLDDYEGYHFTGGAIRLAIWKMSMIILKRDNAWIWGVGTGDSQDKLVEIYKERHVYPGDEEHEGFMHYNAHNQFIQFFLTLGVLGLVWFTLIVAIIFHKSVNINSMLFFNIALIFTAFSITESTLSSQKGIIFFAFFTSLFMSQSRPVELCNSPDK